MPSTYPLRKHRLNDRPFPCSRSAGLCCPCLPVLWPDRTPSWLHGLSSVDLWPRPSPGLSTSAKEGLPSSTPDLVSIPLPVPRRGPAPVPPSLHRRCLLPSLVMSCSALSAFRRYNVTRLQDSRHVTGCSLAPACLFFAAGSSPGSYGRLSASQLGSATGRLGPYPDGSLTRWSCAACLGATWKYYTPLPKKLAARHCLFRGGSRSWEMGLTAGGRCGYRRPVSPA